MKTVVTRTGNVVTLREQSDSMNAELMPLEPNGWKEGREFRRQTAAANEPRYVRADPFLSAIVLGVYVFGICMAAGWAYLIWKAFQ